MWWGYFTWFLLYVALPAGLAYLGGILLAADEPEEQPDVEGAQSRSWHPRTTKAEGLPRPRAYGENMHHGNIVSQWTDVDGNDREILYMIVEHCDGPTEGIGANIVYLNDQPAGNFGSVNIQERLGTMDQTVMTGFEQSKLEYGFQNTELIRGEAVTTFTTPNDWFDDLEYTIFFPNGLITYRKDGSSKGVGTKLKVRIRPVGGGWTTIHDAYINGETLEPLFYNFLVSDEFAIVRGTQYELEFSRTVGAESSRSKQNMHLRSVREVVDTPFTRPGKALIGIKAVATAQLSGSIDVKVIRQDRILNVYDGTNWTLEYSNNRADVIWDLLTQPVISGNGGGTPYAIERYEGIDPAYLDIEFFYAWKIFCAEEILDGYGGTEARCACNIIVDRFTDVWSLAHKLAAVGRASVYWKGDKLTGWIDTTVTIPVDLVTMDSMMAKTWKNQWAVVDELTGVVEIVYKDKMLGYEMTTAEYTNEDAGSYKNSVSLEGLGLTSRGPAVHYAKHLITRNELIRNMNSFRVSKEGFRYSLGDVIRLQSRPSNWGLGYRVVDDTADTVTVDRDVTAEVSAGDDLYVRSYDAVAEEVVIDAYVVDSVAADVITITVPWDIAPTKGSLIAVEGASATKLRRIVKLTPAKDNYFDVEVETYDVDLFDADDINPDNPNVNYIWPGALPNLNPSLVRADLDDLVAQMLPPQPNLDIPWIGNCTWTGSGGDTVTWSATDGTTPITFRYRGTTYEIAPDSTTDEYIYWDPVSTTVFLDTNLASTALDTGHWLMCINTAGVAYPANGGQQIIHAGVLLAGTIRAETYLELRNTYVYNGDDSLDNAHGLEIPFKIVSEMIDINSAKLSFRLMPYRAYSTAAASGGGSTTGLDGFAQTGTGGTGSTNFDGSGGSGSASPGTNNAGPNQTGFSMGPGSHNHSISGGSHGHTVNGHTHTTPAHQHGIGNHTHSVGFHQHSTPNHVHGVTYGLHEESNSPTVHYHIDNGAGYGGASGNFNSDQLDIDISGALSGTGWRSIRFDTDLRCRIACIIELKLDINA